MRDSSSPTWRVLKTGKATLLAAVLALSALAAGQGSATRAADGQSVHVSSGAPAYAKFVTVGPCVTSSYFVLVVQDVLKQSPGGPARLLGGTFITNEFDACTGEAHYGYANFQPTPLSFGSAQSVRVVGSVATSDLLEPTLPPRTFALDLRLIATEPPRLARERYSVEIQGARVTFRGATFAANASATGSITRTAPTRSGNLIEGISASGRMERHRESAIWLYPKR